MKWTMLSIGFGALLLGASWIAVRGRVREEALAATAATAPPEPALVGVERTAPAPSAGLLGFLADAEHPPLAHDVGVDVGMRCSEPMDPALLAERAKRADDEHRARVASRLAQRQERLRQVLAAREASTLAPSPQPIQYRSFSRAVFPVHPPPAQGPTP